jgi:hypothetical protein
MKKITYENILITPSLVEQGGHDQAFRRHSSVDSNQSRNHLLLRGRIK